MLGVSIFGMIISFISLMVTFSIVTGKEFRDTNSNEPTHPLLIPTLRPPRWFDAVLVIFFFIAFFIFAYDVFGGTFR